MTPGTQLPGPTAERPPRPARPVLVELAAALLIVGSAVNLLLSIDVLLRLAQAGTAIGVLTVATVALGVATLGLGLLVRSGRAWLVAVNVVAVLAFLELISGSAVGLVLGALDVLIVLILIAERPWFARMAGRAEGVEAERTEAEGAEADEPA